MFLLSLIVGGGSVWAQSWTNSDLANGRYVLYNVGSGRYLGPGNSWGTQASLIQFSHYNTLAKKSDGVYTIESQVSNGGTKYYFTGSYMDGNAADVTIKDNGEGIFTLSNGTTYYGYDGSSTVLASNLTDPTNANAQWKVMAYDEVYANASAENPVDVTYMILCSNFDRNNRNASAWQKEGNNCTIGGGGLNENGTSESWQSAFNAYQTITVPNGTYKLRAQAWIREYTETGKDYPVIYLNNASVPFKKMQTETADRAVVGNYFWKGDNGEFYFTDYTDDVTVTNGSLTVGAKGTRTNTWCVWDNFQLVYMGPIDLSAYATELANAISAAEAVEGTIPTAVYANISSVITQYNQSYETEEEYVAAINAINNAVSTYATSQMVSAYAYTLKAYALYNQTNYSEKESGAKAAFKAVLDAVNEQTTVDGVNTANAAIPAALATFMSKIEFSDNGYFDITPFFLTNADFSAGNISGWETNFGNGQATNFGYQGASYQNGNVSISQFIEAWKNGAALGDGYLRQTVSGLPEGKYVLGVDVVAYNQPGNKRPTGGALLYIYADGIDYPTTRATGNGQPEHFETEFLNTGEGDVIFGLRTESTDANWIAADNFTVKFYGIDLSAYETQLSNEVTNFGNFEASVESTVYANLKSQVDALNTTYNSSKTYATAIANVQTINTYAAAYATATATKDNSTYENVSGAELSELVAAIADAPTYADFTTYEAKTTALTTATNTFIAAAPNYDALAREIKKAKALGMEAATVDAYAATAESTAATALANTQNLMVAEYNFVSDNYSYAVNLGTWNASDNAGTMTSQHWDGTSTSPYLEQGGGNLAYNLNSWTVTYDQTLNLPAGNYVFKVAGRTASDHVTLNLNVTNVNDAENPVLLGTVNDFPKGDTGLGINKAGKTSFDANDEAGFARDGNGGGWQWRYVQFTHSEPAAVKVAVVAEADAQYRWMGFCNATVQTDDQDNVALMEALVALNEAKAAATLTQHANVGSGVFQLNETTDNTLWNAYTTAKTNADNFSLTAETTATAVASLIAALQTAQNAYNNNVAINAPDPEKRYTVSIIEEGKDWNGNAITMIAGGRNDQGNYGIKYLAAANVYMMQAFKFTAVEGETNQYYMSMIDVDGTERYITTAQKGYDTGYNEQMRTTTEAANALAIKIIPSLTEQNFVLYNTLASKNIANNGNNDVYTANTANFTIAEAAQAEVEVSIAAGKLATRIFPFKPAAIEDVKFFSATVRPKDGAEGVQTVGLTEVADPQANTPYILLNETNDKIDIAQSGWGTASADSYAVGALTGVYTAAEIAADAGNYILQTQKGVQAFYLVSGSDITATPYRAYLTAPSNAGARIAFEFDETTGINGVNAAEKKFDRAVYDLSGRKVAQPTRGLYIVNGKKVVIK